MSKIVELEKQLMQRNKELDVVRVSVLAASIQMGVARPSEHSSSRLVQCRACSFQRSALKPCTYCNHFTGGPQKYSYYVCTNVCIAINISFHISLSQLLEATMVSYLGDAELILWVLHVVVNRNNAQIKFFPPVYFH